MSRTPGSRPAHNARPLAARMAALLALLGLLLSASGASAAVLDCPCPSTDAAHATAVDDCGATAAAAPSGHQDDGHREPVSAPACPCDCDCILTCCNWIAMPADAPPGVAVLAPAPDGRAAMALPPDGFVIDPAYPPPRA